MTPEVTELPSGLRVATLLMPHVETVSLSVTIAAGSRDETVEEHGLAHFLEHMAFKGTTRRSALAIAEEIETVGGDLNAATSTETTSYTVRVLAGDLPLAIDVIADILLESVFDPAEVKREKEVVLQELAAVEDTPDDFVHDLFADTAFAGHPVGRPILGAKKTVRSFNPAMLRAFLATCYRPQETVVAAAGAVNHAEVVAAVERHFSKMDRSLPGRIKAPASYRGGEKRLTRGLEQAHVLLGFEAPALHHPDYFASQVFANAAGGGMSSRLFQEVREKRGLAYAVYSFVWGYADTGLFGVYFGADDKMLGEAAHVSLDCLMASLDDMSDAEVARARAQLKVSMLMAMESSSARADQMARHLLLYGRIIPPQETIARVDAITVADVRRVGRDMLASTPTLTAIGQLKRLPMLEMLAGRIGVKAAA